ncbi:hypothetical protein [Desulfuromonas thiophila]|jgi:hypothetical protein|uniref:hypothetical protein n=1 Tax=Desulfuromonas thiophila TaxID=57664 RepID=UPI0029F51F89|nr:hypothetical protein [Desulfuromonas thiophila]
MFFIPLAQRESIALVVHALRAAAGEADCRQCPARRVCMKQCLVIADSIAAMLDNGTLPALADEPQDAPAGEVPPEVTSIGPGKGRKPHLEVVK